MRAKSGFILRNVVDEYMLMPTGENLGRFNGTVILNDVSAFVWQQLENEISFPELLNALTAEYRVERDVA